MKLYPYEKEWFKQFNTYFVDVNNKNIDELEEWSVEFIVNQLNI
jgi:hypothetical protein